MNSVISKPILIMVSVFSRECMALLKELDAPVKYIILTTHAYEHKIFIAPFQRRFKDAQVYVVPK